MVAAGGAPPGGADPISGKLQTSVDYNKRVALTQADAQTPTPNNMYGFRCCPPMGKASEANP